MAGLLGICVTGWCVVPRAHTAGCVIEHARASPLLTRRPKKQEEESSTVTKDYVYQETQDVYDNSVYEYSILIQVDQLEYPIGQIIPFAAKQSVRAIWNF